MSIQNEITRLQGVKSNILAAIEAKNVIVPPGAALADSPDLIAAITGGGGEGIIAKPILAQKRMYVVDSNGNIGLDVTNYFQWIGSNFDYAFAIVVEGADYSGLGLGKVMFYDIANDIIGGREYRTVTIGGKVWMAENLDYKVAGIAIGSGGRPSTPAAWYYNNSEATYGVNGNKYGLLYNWHAVKYLNDNKATLMPGWHVPTSTEWDALANAVGGTGVAGTELKAASGWSSGNGTDNYGFSVFPAGHRNSGSFLYLGSDAMFWTATEYSSTFAYARFFSTSASMGSNYNYKADYAYSVRLVKDS